MTFLRIVLCVAYVGCAMADLANASHMCAVSTLRRLLRTWSCAEFRVHAVTASYQHPPRGKHQFITRRSCTALLLANASASRCANRSGSSSRAATSHLPRPHGSTRVARPPISTAARWAPSARIGCEAEHESAHNPQIPGRGVNWLYGAHTSVQRAHNPMQLPARELVCHHHEVAPAQWLPTAPSLTATASFRQFLPEFDQVLWTAPIGKVSECVQGLPATGAPPIPASHLCA